MKKLTTTNYFLDRLQHYFPYLNAQQIDLFKQLPSLYEEWNNKINVISRKDIDNIGTHHILHSLGIAKVMQFCDGTKIWNIGTGGGFPGIPLAIMFPNCSFLLMDSIGKKIKVVQAITDELGLQNVKAVQARAETVNENFDFVVSRAVTSLIRFYPWVKGKFSLENKNTLPNGVLYLKGGNVNAEVNPFGKRVSVYELSDFFDELFFETKKVIYLKG